MYNSTPALTLPSISEPTVPITKAGPAFMQKRQALCASFSVIAFFLSNSYVIFAPMGNPPICDIIITGAKTPGSLNSFSHTLSNGFPAASPRPERRRKEATVINGNRDGTTVSAAKSIPLLTPSEHISGLVNKNRHTKAVNITGTIYFRHCFLSILFTLFRNLNI